MPVDRTIVVIAKEPRPGRVKTRLTPPCSPEEAAGLAEAALTDTLQVVAETPAVRRVLALDGRPGDWLPAGFDVVPQADGGLDERIAAAIAPIDGPMVLVGMDTPQLTSALLACDFADKPAWIGLAEDGGFWALGLACPDPGLVRGVPMSTPYTGAVQRRRLAEAGLEIGELPRLRDVDEWDDALAVARTAPHTRFARQLRRIQDRAA
ncbi:TIGR04282 family arsenosugar biosynthesis glycosyltransferase [Flindersiella endophytica]